MTGRRSELEGCVRYDVDRVRHGIAELVERWDKRLKPNELDIAEAYLRGDLCIVIKLDVTPRGDVGDKHKFTATASHHIVGEVGIDRPVFIEDYDVGDFGASHHRRNDGVLIRIVELVKGIRAFPFPSGNTSSALSVSIID